ncbi:hypothetical protein LCGC14_2235780 [marine sediment metagenome]|uniref:Uncharacterized protein n=1 Tax=marine sediment metagenome TaxID=412755 RepID=A0A0F9D752_9ZZZZ
MPTRIHYWKWLRWVMLKLPEWDWVNDFLFPDGEDKNTDWYGEPFIKEKPK